MNRRYFSQTTISGPEIVLTGSEAHHLLHVMRAAPGDRVTLFDGGGAEFEAEVKVLGRREVKLNVLGRREVDRELPLRITLAVALPKGERQKWLVEKLVELGAAAVVPLVAERSVSRPNGEALSRLRRTVIEASKQCGRNRLMQIEEPRRWSDFVRETLTVPRRLLAHPGGAEDFNVAATSGPAADRPPCERPMEGSSVVAAVGPEGGFTDEEIALALAAGWRQIGLGRRILRVETAAMLLLGIVSAEFLCERPQR
jgi:16S rRNA (uracil1498-N3)-methyltransferase